MNQIKEITKDCKILSDTHFGHKNIEKYEPIRVDFTKEKKMKSSNDLLIKNWNENISKNELILHLGDYAFESPSNSFNKLNGKIILILGNHDLKKVKYFKEKFYGVIDKPIIDLPNINNSLFLENMKKELNEDINRLSCCLVKEINGKRILFSHFPVFDENPYDEKYRNVRNQLEWIYIKLDCDLNLYGHTHSKKSVFEDSISVSVENIGFKPVTIKEILGI